MWKNGKRNKNGLMNRMVRKGLVFGVLIILFISIAPVGIVKAKSMESYSDSVSLLRSIPLKHGVYNVQISGDGNYIALCLANCGEDDNIYLFDRDPLWTYSAFGRVKSISISDDGKYIVASNTGMLVGGEIRNSHYIGGGEIQNSQLLLFIRENKTPLWTYELSPRTVHALSISGNGKYIVAGSIDGRIYMFNTSNNTPIWTADVGNGISGGMLSISDTGEYIAVGSGENIYLFSKDSNLPIWSTSVVGAGVYGWISNVAISGDGSTLVVGAGRKIYCYAIPDGKLLWEYKIGSYIDELLWKYVRIVTHVGVERISLSSTGDRILVVTGGDTSFGKEGIAFLFGKSTNKPLWRFQTDDYLICGDISQNGKLIAFGGSNKVYFFNDIKDIPISVFNASGITCGCTEFNTISVSGDGIHIVVGTSGESPMLYIFEYILPIEDAFNYNGEYTLDEAKLRAEEKKVFSYVMKYAKEYKVSPCLIMAVIRQESDFFDYSQDPDKDKTKFDIGYMQVSYGAAIDTYKEYTGDEYKGKEEEWQKDGLDPDINIKYGTRYLRIQYERIKEGHYKDVYNDILKSTLSAYNAGHPTKDNSKYVDEVINGRDLIDGQRRGYEFFLTIRVPVGGVPASEKGVPGFEVIFAIAGLLAVAYLLRRRK
jgi:PGF-CTERM protein